MLVTENLSAAERAFSSIRADIPQRAFDPNETVVEIFHAGVSIGFTSYEIEVRENFRELVILATAAPNAAASAGAVRLRLQEFFDSLAVRENCDSLRFHTSRTGLVESAMRQGWRISEVILRKKLK